LYRRIGVSACNQFVLNGFGGAVLNFLAKLREVGCQQYKAEEPQPQKGIVSAYRGVGVSACNQFVLNRFGGAVLNFLAKLREVGHTAAQRNSENLNFVIFCGLLFNPLFALSFLFLSLRLSCCCQRSTQ
jgi:hypothetical protein